MTGAARGHNTDKWQRANESKREEKTKKTLESGYQYSQYPELPKSGSEIGTRERYRQMLKSDLESQREDGRG